MYNFNEKINRKNTDCLKYDFAKERGYPEDLLSMWVADMDIRAPKEVNEVIVNIAELGIYGYTDAKENYYETVKSWFFNNYDWKPETEWFVKTPGVVYAIATAIRAFTNENDSILIQPPVYYPFAMTIKSNNRKLVTNPLKYDNGNYSIDFTDFEEKIRNNDVKMFIFCNPHNPVGKSWNKEDIKRLGEICLENEVIFVSDEIHCDLVYEGKKHHTFLSIDERFKKNSIVCTAPSKTFNLAGLQVSNIFIPNRELREKFKYEMSSGGVSQLNCIGIKAAKAAYQYGYDWLKELKKHLIQNIDYVDKFLKARLPKIKLIRPEGTYLIWLDFSETGLTDAQIEDKIINEAKLWLDGGSMFGEEGEKFQRINIACPINTVKEAMKRIESAFKEY